jgi:hypothetical protein
MGLKLNMNAPGNSGIHFGLKPGGYSYLREEELYGMNIINIRKTNNVAECTLGH